MTNQERNMKAVNASRFTPVPAQRGNDASRAQPWSPRELRQFWAMANQVYGKAALERVHDAIGFQFHVERMHELTREEFVRLMGDLAKKAAVNKTDVLDGYFAGTAMDPTWRRIRWLQRQLGWTDTHLVNYVKWVTGIDHVRWLSVNRSRAVISGMEKIRSREKQRVNGGTRQWETIGEETDKRDLGRVKSKAQGRTPGRAAI